MFRSICILAFVAAALAVPHHRFEKVDPYVVNGTDAPQGKYPFVVSMQWLGDHGCGGTILNENWLLTAAHCFKNEIVDLWAAYAGDVDLKGNGERHQAVQYVIHEDYDPDNQYIHDIALVRVDPPFIFSDNIQPVTLASQNQDTEGGTPSTVIGWGRNYTGGDKMQILQEVDIFVFADSECEEIHGGAPHPSNICAGVPEGGKGHCSNDSGGPLLVDGEQVGLVSWSIKPCTAAPYPAGVYTEVSWYVDWINSKIN